MIGPRPAPAMFPFAAWLTGVHTPNWYRLVLIPAFPLARNLNLEKK